MASKSRLLREFVHGLEFVPSWRAPHHFYAFASDLQEWRGDDEPQGTQHVFTAGLLVHDLIAGDLTTSRGVLDVGRRVGFEWLGSYADVVLEKRSPLAKWMSSIGVAVPGQESSRAVVGEPLPEKVPDKTLAAFSALGTRIAQHRSVLEPFINELVRAARRREAPRSTSDGLRWLESRLSLNGARLAPTSGGWSLDFPNLDARVKFELFEVFNTRPRLHLCPLCERVYVPRTASQTRCRRELYTWPDQTSLRGCAPKAILDSDRHRREYKRLAEAHRRSRARHGARSEQARSTKQALDHYRQTHFGRVGRPPKDRPVTRIHHGGVNHGNDR